jgi:hypothetical protein
LVGRVLASAGFSSIVRLYLFNARRVPYAEVDFAIHTMQLAVIAASDEQTGISEPVFVAWLSRLVMRNELDVAASEFLSESCVADNVSRLFAKFGLCDRAIVLRLLLGTPPVSRTHDKQIGDDDIWAGVVGLFERLLADSRGLGVSLRPVASWSPRLCVAAAK